mgnify:CR=1 FL=1
MKHNKKRRYCYDTTNLDANQGLKGWSRNLLQGTGYFFKESPEEVVWQYNDRACIENHIKEIKTGFGMEHMPSGDFGANAVYFAIGIMTYNIFIAQKYFTMPLEWASKTIKSIRWLLVEVVGRVIERSRRVYLKIATTVEKYKIYLNMRQRLNQLCAE